MYGVGIGRLNRTGGLRFYYQLISFVSIKVVALNLPDFKMKVIQQLKMLSFGYKANL